MLKYIFPILFMGLVSCWGRTTYYDWSGPAFSNDTTGVDRSLSGDPDADRLVNAEEYAFSTDPLAADEPPLTIQMSNAAVNLQFPWNLSAFDLDWGVERSDALVSNGWNAAAHVSATTNAGCVRIELEEAGASGFFRINPSVAAPELIVDSFDDGLGWLVFNNAQFVSASGSLFPMVGSSFFKHSVSTTWSASGMYKPTNLVLEEGRYVLSVSVGHDGSSRPFAENAVTLGFFDSTNAVGRARDIRDAVVAWDALSGLTRSDLFTPVPSNGWENWSIEYTVAAGSEAIGRSVSIGVYAQSNGDGGSQAMFDGISVARLDAAPLTVYAAEEVAEVDPLMFGANLVYHTQVIDTPFSNAFEACGLELLRYPGGTICEQEFDYLDSDGPDDDRPSLFDTVAFCNATDTELVLVVPTKRFVGDSSAAAQYAADFVTAVNVDHDFGDIEVTRWELGNEYYADPNGAPELTAAQYAELAGAMADAMLAVDPSVEPIVQFYRSSADDTQTIADGIGSSVKGCLTHTYPWTNSFEYVTQTEIPAQLEAGRQIYGLDELLITEWNIASESAPTGMRLAELQLTLFESLLRGGATAAAVWPLSWNNNGVKTVLSDYATGALRPPGAVFARLADKAKGAVLVQTDYDFDSCAVSAYRKGDAELTLFVACRDLPANTLLQIAVEDFAFSSADAERIGADNELSHSTPESGSMEVTLSGGFVWFEANAFYDREILRITLLK